MAVFDASATGSSAYQLPNYAPIAQGYAMLGRGIESFFDRKRKDEEREKSQAALQGYFSQKPEDRQRNFGSLSPEHMGLALGYEKLWGGKGPGERFEEVRDDDGNIVGQRSSLTGRVVAHPGAGTAKKPDVFETVKNPFGLGGVGQRNKTTGKIANYQKPAAGAEGATKWETLTDDAGNVVGQRNTLTGEVKADPRASKRSVGAVYDLEKKARTEWKGESGVFRDTQDAMRRVVSAAKRGTAAGDLAMVFNFMKTLDPGSVVRESEYATAENARGVPEGIRNMYNRLVKGERLTPPQRLDFVGTVSDIYMGQVEQQERKRKQFIAAIGPRGIKPEVVTNYIDRGLIEDLSNLAELPDDRGTAPIKEAKGAIEGAVKDAAQWMFGGDDDDTPTGNVIPGDKVEQVGLFRPSEGLSGLPNIPAPAAPPAQEAPAAPSVDPAFMGGVGTVSGAETPAAPAAPQTAGFDPAMATPDRFSRMSLDQLKAIPPEDIGKMSPEELDALEAAYMALAGARG